MVTGTKTISVVIPTAGRRPQLLLECLKSIAAQDVPHETIVVSPPGRILSSEVMELAQIVEERGPTSAALNAGIRLSHGEVVAITNDDCTASRGWLRELTEPVLSSSAVLCGGQSLPSRPGRAYPATYAIPFEEPRLVQLDSSCPVWEIGLVGNNFSMRRSLLDQVGPFNERLGPGTPMYSGEDLDLFHRVLAKRLPICINPRAVVFHEPLETWIAELRMMYSYRVGLAAYLYSHRHEPEAGNLLVRELLAGQLRRVWRNIRQGRGERFFADTIALLGLAMGLTKGPFFLG